MQTKYLALFTTVFCVGAMTPVWAAKTVSSSGVTKGNLQIENNGQFGFDDEDGGDSWEHGIDFEYGLTDRVMVELSGKVEKPEDEDAEYEATEIKVNYKMTGEESFLNTGFEVGYGMNHLGGADSVGFELRTQKKYGQWDQRFNIGTDHEVGEDSESGLSLDIEAGSYYDFGEYKLGLEYFADFGRLKDNLSYSEQDHLLGPVVNFSVPVMGKAVNTQLGYLAGISDAATDHNIKYVIEVNF